MSNIQRYLVLSLRLDVFEKFQVQHVSMRPENTIILSFGQLNTNFTDLNICMIVFQNLYLDTYGYKQ